ncbi:MAG: hypothetical protein E7080_05195 [Bacteroidales bacterium]|nr:hypothetical protein [Bacteroidales bacterium]
MIRKLNIVLLCCVVVAVQSCMNHGTMDRRLFYADSLANEEKADYAMSMLMGVDYDNLDEWNRHYYDLLIVKINDKTDNAHKSDSLILDVVNYFKDTDSYAELTAAYYYGGRVYSVIGNTPQALDFYRKAYNRLDDSPSSLKGRIAYQMGRINLDLYQFEEAKIKFKEAIGYHETMGGISELVYSYRRLGETFEQIGDIDSAYMYMKKAKTIAYENEPFGKDNIGVSAQISNFHLNNYNVKAAVVEYDSILPYLSKDNTSNYSIIAGINVYMANGNFNRAEIFAKQLLKTKSIQNDKIAYATLLDIARNRNNLDDVALYTIKYKNCTDSLAKLYSYETKKLRNTLYNYSIRAEEHEIDSDRRVRQNNIFIVIVLLVGIGMVSIVGWVINHNRKLKRQSIIQLKRIEELIANSTTIVMPVAENEENLSATEQLQARFKEIISQVNPKEIKVADTILNSEVYAKLKHSLYTDMEVKPTDEDWVMLDEVVNQAYPEFKNKLFALAKLSDYEYKVCLLVKCKFSPSEMAAITFHSKTSVASTRSRFCGKFFCYNGVASDADKFILSL